MTVAATIAAGNAVDVPTIAAADAPGGVSNAGPAVQVLLGTIAVTRADVPARRAVRN